MSLTIAVYTRSESYGGPEEGGWTYPSGTLVAHAQVRDADEVERVESVFREIYDERDYSVLTLDDEDEGDLALFFNYHRELIREIPKVRPHYE